MVTLSSYSFDENHPPKIYAGESMPARYQLRAKFIDPSTGTPYQATELFNNDGLKLDNLPAPNVYTTVSLRWIKYDDSTGTRTLGPENFVSVTITNGTPPAGCTPCNSLNQRCVCDEDNLPPDKPDDHGCSPYRERRDCEAPSNPQAECGEKNFTIQKNPDIPNQFQIISILFDESCDAILDEGSNEILTIVA